MYNLASYQILIQESVFTSNSASTGGSLYFYNTADVLTETNNISLNDNTFI